MWRCLTVDQTIVPAASSALKSRQASISCGMRPAEAVADHRERRECPAEIHEGDRPAAVGRADPSRPRHRWRRSRPLRTRARGRLPSRWRLFLTTNGSSVSVGPRKARYATAAESKRAPQPHVAAERTSTRRRRQRQSRSVPARRRSAGRIASTSRRRDRRTSRRRVRTRCPRRVTRRARRRAPGRRGEGRSAERTGRVRLPARARLGSTIAGTIDSNAGVKNAAPMP